MYTKIRLFFQIRKFYTMFGSIVGENFITRLSDMTADNVHDVLFDIHEVLDDFYYDDTYGTSTWLINLERRILNYCEKSSIAFIGHIALVVVALIFAIGSIGAFVGNTIGFGQFLIQVGISFLVEWFSLKSLKS